MYQSHYVPGPWDLGTFHRRRIVKELVNPRKCVPSRILFKIRPMLNHTSATQKAWESLFISKLLARTSDAFDGVKECSIRMKAANQDELAYTNEIQLEVEKEEKALKQDGTEMPISVKVHCKGLSYKKLSLSDDVLSAVVLQESYNEVHGSIDGDGITLSGITFTGNTLATGPTTNLRRTDLQRWGQDDGGYSGSFDCHLWPDYVLGENLDSTSATHKAWESLFTSKLLESGDGFQGAKKCSISMKVGSNADAME
jgi:hypothetical protein